MQATQPRGPIAVNATATDPAGDTFGGGPVQHDVIAMTAEVQGTQLVIGVEFAGPIAPFDEVNPFGVGGWIDLDTDQNILTGTTGETAEYCQEIFGLGVDYSIVLFDYNPATGTFVVTDGAGNPVGTASVVFGGTSFIVRVDLATIGGDDGIVDLATVVGTAAEPTDCAPDGTALTSTFLDQTVPGIPTLDDLGRISLFLALAGVALFTIIRRS